MTARARSRGTPGSPSPTPPARRSVNTGRALPGRGRRRSPEDRAGQSVHAVVKTPGEDVTDGDSWKKPAKIKVCPPDNTAALSAEAPAALQVCGETFTVGPFAAEAP
ncbi:DUF4232 domain-containing protein [Streptomyces globisporus]|uniref:DUF4232 domain-containing protein n=1 Tax=Streptomyces globisporus TaxID=1908 RepID=UPI0036A02FB5